MFNNNKLFSVMGGGKALNYRSDIDGLRAIACLAVVLFHAFPSRLQGGFIGVDIFFVISGFLISSIIYRNLFNNDNPGQLNIIDFYVRRIRRIFPALITILVFSLILGYFVLLQSEFNLLAKHTFGGSTYISNFLLYFESGNYFDPDSRTKPLLHLWSLGVEEQFYLFFPFILYLIYRLNLNFLLTLIIFSALSFSLNVNFIHHNLQSRAFYLPWCRFWELSSGAILAYIVNYHQTQLNQINNLIERLRITEVLSKIIYREPTKEQQSCLIANIIALIGICLIIAGIFLLKNNANFPGKSALIPVVGSLFVIAAGKKSFINKYILSNRLMVFFGLISYPLYLWHWPILSFIHITDGNTPSWIRASAVIVSIILATLTFYLIEPPLRYGKHSGLKAIFLFLTLLVIGIFGYLQANNYLNMKVYSKPNNEQYSIRTYRIWNKDEFNERFRIPEDKETHSLVNNLWKKIDNCLKQYPSWAGDTRCYLNEDQENTSYVLFGDSHAGNLLYGLEKIEKDRRIKFNSFQNSMTVPFYGFMSSTHYPNVDWRIKTSDLMYDAFNNEACKENIKIFVLAHCPETSYSDITDKLDASTNNKSPEERWRIGMTRTIDFLTKHGKKVLFVLDSPSLPFSPASCIDRPISLLKKECKFERAIHNNRQANSLYNKLVKEYAEKYSNVEYIDLADAFCNDKYCFGNKNHVPLYADGGHTNLKGSEFEANFVYAKIKEMLTESE